MVAALALIVIAAFLAVAIGGFSLAVAIRTGSSEATQAMFPLTFVIIFVSSAFFPTGLMTGWYQEVAEVNPFTLIVNPARQMRSADSTGATSARRCLDRRRLLRVARSVVPGLPDQAATLVTATDLHPSRSGGRLRAVGAAAYRPDQRSVTRMIRLPAVLAPTVIMPAFFVTAFTGSFDGISRVEGYPTDNIVNWVAAFAILQSCASPVSALRRRWPPTSTPASSIGSGVADAARARAAGTAGQAAVRALIPTTIILLICVLKGASMPAGIRGGAVVYVGGMSMAVVMGLLGLGVVLLIGNIRAMALVQVISFLVLFPSTGQVPIELMDGWLATMARWNPATPLLAMTRQGFLGEISWSETWPGLLVIGGGLALFGAFARTQLRRLDG